MLFRGDPGGKHERGTAEDPANKGGAQRDGKITGERICSIRGFWRREYSAEGQRRRGGGEVVDSGRPADLSRDYGLSGSHDGVTYCEPQEAVAS